MNYNLNVAHIVYASNDKFAEILGVPLVSLYENSKDMDDIVVYVLDSGIEKQNKDKLLSVSRNYNRHEITFIHAKNISEKLSMAEFCYKCDDFYHLNDEGGYGLE